MGETKMNSQAMQTKKSGSQFWVALALVAVAIIGFYKANAAASDSVQTTFATPAAAGQALLDAARAQDEKALAKILGPDSPVILSSGDVNEDKKALQSFVGKFEQMNRWVKMTRNPQHRRRQLPIPDPARAGQFCELALRHRSRQRRNPRAPDRS
jgi:Protein of unknown function (DUF2950)